MKNSYKALTSRCPPVFLPSCQVLPSKGHPVEEALSKARLAACDAARINLAVALRLIGVSAPEVM